MALTILSCASNNNQRLGSAKTCKEPPQNKTKKSLQRAVSRAV
jgi:hypothetical protein